MKNATTGGGRPFSAPRGPRRRCRCRRQLGFGCTFQVGPLLGVLLAVGCYNVLNMESDVASEVSDGDVPDPQPLVEEPLVC